jgi:hypothetical protein
MELMNARVVGRVAFGLLATVGLTACGGTSVRVGPVSPSNAPAPFSDLTHPHRYEAKEVKAAFARQGIGLREMRTPYGAHVVVLFDPRWPAPTDFRLDGGSPSPPTYIWVFVHANDSAPTFVQDGNVYVANGPGEGRSVNAALHTLDLSFKD